MENNTPIFWNFKRLENRSPGKIVKEIAEELKSIAFSLVLYNAERKRPTKGGPSKSTLIRGRREKDE